MKVPSKTNRSEVLDRKQRLVTSVAEDAIVTCAWLDEEYEIDFLDIANARNEKEFYERVTSVQIALEDKASALMRVSAALCALGWEEIV